MLSPDLRKRLKENGEKLKIKKLNKDKITPRKVRKGPSVLIQSSKLDHNYAKRKYCINMLDRLINQHTMEQEEKKEDVKERKLVVFVLKKSPEYDIDYVEKLITSLKEHITVDVEFVGLSDTDVSEYATWINFEHDWSGWWCKMELFSHPYLRGKNIIYFDLDTVINKNIDPLIEYNHSFTMLQDFYFPKRYGSGLMAWSGDRKYITEKFMASPKHHIKKYVTSQNWGDQAFIRDHVNQKIEIMQNITPVRVGSYKVSSRRFDYHIICFHGKPRPRSVGWKI